MMGEQEVRVDRGAVAAIQRDQPEVPPAAPTDEERSAADRALTRFPDFARDQLLPLLLEVQAEAGWFSLELTRYLCQRTGVPFSDLYGVISFYALLKTRPTGRTVIRVCKGVPCYLQGASQIGEHLQALLGVGPEEPRPDGRISWEWFACLGQCDHAPAVLVGEEAVRPVNPELVTRLVASLESEEGDAR
jgi:NADH:ubiquinone oxidoreductase subunit E